MAWVSHKRVTQEIEDHTTLRPRYPAVRITKPETADLAFFPARSFIRPSLGPPFTGLTRYPAGG